MAGLVTWNSSNSPSVWGTINQVMAAAINAGQRVTDQNGNPVTVVSFIPGVGIVPQGAPNSGYLANGCPLNVWFANPQDGPYTSGWVAGQQDALRAAGITTCLPPPAPIVSNYGTTQQGSIAPIVSNYGTTQQGSIGNVGVTASSSAVAAAIAPSLTPGTTGSLPTTTGGAVNANVGPSQLYRFILQDTTTGVYHTGANYPGCSQTNSSLCDPQDFNSLSAAISYATSRGEIPYITYSAGEVWSIIAGTTSINQAQILSSSSGVSNWLLYGGIALVAYYFFLK